MKKLLSAISLLLALLLLATGCTGPAVPSDTTEGTVTEAPTDPADTTETPTEEPTEPSESDTEPEAEPAAPALGDQIDLIAHTLTAGDGKITLTMAAEAKEAGLAGTVKLTLSDANGMISESSFAADGEHTAVLECPADKLNGELSIVGSVTSPDGEVLDEMTLMMKNGLPQLTPDGVRCVVAAMTAEYDRRRRLIYNGLHDIGIESFEPEGAFYIYPNIGKFGLTSEAFCEKLLYEHKCAIVPGVAFGAAGEGFARISYAYSVKHINQALERMEAFIRTLK